MTTTFQQAVNKIEEAFQYLETKVEGYVKDTVEPAVEAEWAVLKPQVLGLGQTTLSMIWAAAGTWLASGGPFNPGSSAAAIASIMAQVPDEVKALEHLVLAGFSGAVQSIQAKAAAAAAPAPPAA